MCRMIDALIPIGAPLVSLLIAQSVKLLDGYRKDKKIIFQKCVASGGMPSSHSAMVSSIAVAVGMRDGWTSSAFYVSIVLAMIVMYDSTGVRQAVGRHAVILNRLLSGLNEDRQDEKIKEMLGHTPFEVFVGSCLGIAVTLGCHLCL